ncbi:MAG: PQQ-binding-like beta-propeller repeat protein, partial [Deltaproteobacteria bacterium]|nr:PQQ-binding-like beta-propeller repeat protein [Deltaproteobacteria bacterium]
TNSAVYSTPAISDGILYVPSGNRTVYAINVEKGKFAWRKDMGAEMVAYASPVAVGPRLYVAFKNGRIKSFNKTTGAELKDYQLPGEIYSTPVVTGDGTMFVGCDNGHMYALDTWTGSVIWKYETGAGIHSSPAVLEKTLYIGSQDGAVYAFEGW